MEVLHPFVVWGQSKEYLYLSVKLSQVSSPSISIEDDDITFKSHGVGVQGEKMYGFTIVPYHSIIAKESRWEIRDSSIEFILRKEYVDPWPRLTVDTKKLAWVKFDFDRFQFDTSSEDEDDKNKRVAQETVENLTSQLDESAAFIKLLKNPLTIYLLAYNLFQFAGYLFLFGSCVWHSLNEGPKPKQTLYSKVSDQLIVVQLASCLEVLHAAMGWVKSGTIPAIMQVFARNLVLFAMIVPYEHIQNSNVFFYLIFIWSSIEIIRYPYYLLAVIGEENGLLTYLRYTIWIPLYPTGMIAEGKIVLMALPEIEAKNRFSLELPNTWNWSFNFPMFIKAYLFIIIFGLYQQMAYMYKRRKAKIGPNPKSDLNKPSLFPKLPPRPKKVTATGLSARGKAIKTS